MEKLVEESYNKENMKIAMLNHEHTFRHQVYELHRLYRIQKLLMSNISQQNRAKTEEEEEEAEEEETDVIEESEIELTLGPSSQIRGRRRRNKKLGSDSAATSFSSSSSSTTGSAQIVSRNSNCYRNVQFLGGFLEANSTSRVQVDDEIRLTQHHPWLYQVVSLNLT
ncbi:uncharacterized protein LOC111017925 [Momordica charantia]|uniref:Uncharacterized protein LOC111017925 n=1 Tax=Momordica charantia TaxID=3673 RepID=A0A6J1D700_MOMCH|nr:uncharacterized protein LOC111017925 [Momordica charantia]XP_022149513.1 uncharacterized protein LOC111017925 [Momordica charantia]